MSNWWKDLALASRAKATARFDAADAQAIAIQRAANETATYVGVVLAREADGTRESFAWHVFPMTSAVQLSEWFDDWVGTPNLYLFLWAFDKGSSAWTQGMGSRVATPDAHGGHVEITNVGATPAFSDPAASLTVMMLAQDSRWARIVDRAIRTRNPTAKTALAFFKKLWNPTLTSFMQHADPTILDHMHDRIYPAARAVGFPEDSFLLPDIDLGGAP